MAQIRFSGGQATHYLAHAAPVVAGLVLMSVGVVTGAILGITLMGIPVGLLGLLFFFWGLFGDNPV
jgi:hypothetical protein